MAIVNTMPQVYFSGINDKSMFPPEFTDTTTPLLYPLLYLQTEKGQDFQILSMGDGATGTQSAITMLGEKTFDKREKFYNHQTMLAEILIKNGNTVMIRRITTNAKLASVTLVATLSETNEIPYIRDVNGDVQVNTVTGEPLLDTTEGVALIPTLTINFSLVNTASLVDIDGEPSFTPVNNSIYPLLTLDAASVGETGNSIGFKIIPFKNSGTFILDNDVVNHQRALIYGAQLFVRDGLGVSSLVYDNYADDTTEFCLKPNAYNYKIESDLTVQKLVDNYMNNGFDTGGQPVYGNLGKVVEHSNNIKAVLDRMLAKEMVASGVNDFTVDDTYLMNPFTARDINNVHYYGVKLHENSLKFGESRTHWLFGGDDGDTSLDAYDAAVAHDVAYNSENPKYPLLDILRYPFSHVIDSGFKLNTKLTLGSWLAKRRDVNFAGTTWTQGEPTLSISESISRALFIRNTLELYPESVVNATPMCRAVLVDQAGIYPAISTKMELPLLFDFFDKKSKYFGASDGKLKSIFAYDEGDAKVVTTMREITGTWAPYVARVQTFNTGVIHVQSRSQTKFFYPHFQTLYPYKNSILNSEIYVHIVTDIIKKAHICWAILTGSSRLNSGTKVKKMNRETFIKKSNDLMLELTDGLYDNRVEVVPNTFFTANDIKSGISWNLTVTVKGVPSQTVMNLQVEAARFDATNYIA